MPQKNHFQISRGSWASEAPGSCPAASQPPACVSSAGPPRCQLQQGLAPLRAADGVHGPQPLHVAVLRVEAPRRVRRRSESARVLHCLDAAVCQVLVVLELVGVVLEDPELRGRLLLHVLGRAVHRLVGPRVVGPGRPLEVVAPLPALALSVWMPRSTTAMALRSSGRFVRCTAFSGSSRPSVANSLPRSVVTTKFPSSPVSSRAWWCGPPSRRSCSAEVPRRPPG